MFTDDLSYLYSDECFTASNSNEKQFSGRVSKFASNRPVRQRISPILTLRHRSKHILFCRGDIRQCERNRFIARRLREKRQLCESILLKRIQQLEEERGYLENNLRQREAYKRDLQMEINNNFCLNTLSKLFLMEKDTIPSSSDLQLSNVSTENVFDLTGNHFEK